MNSLNKLTLITTIGSLSLSHLLALSHTHTHTHTSTHLSQKENTLLVVQKDAFDDFSHYILSHSNTNTIMRVHTHTHTHTHYKSKSKPET